MPMSSQAPPGSAGAGDVNTWSSQPALRGGYLRAPAVAQQTPRARAAASSGKPGGRGGLIRIIFMGAPGRGARGHEPYHGAMPLVPANGGVIVSGRGMEMNDK